jgi:Flp pilus assembly protein protease CpaA
MLAEITTLLGTSYLSYKDIKERRIPNPAILTLLVIGTILSTVNGFWFIIGIKGAALPLVLWEFLFILTLSLPLYIGDLIGPGDVKLLSIMPFLLPVEATGIFILSIGQSMIASLVKIIRENKIPISLKKIKEKKEEDGLPFAPFVFISVCVMLSLRMII